jgi:predicted permease
MGTFWSDLRYAFRTLRKSPAFAAVAVLTLAVGIGANAAIFSVVNSLFLHPPGIAHAERVVAVRAKYDKLGLLNIVVSAPDFAQVRDAREVFDSAAMVMQMDFNYMAEAGPQRLVGAQVTSQWFEVFRAKPMLGRTFVPEEDQPNANHEVVLAYGAWRRWFGGDPNVVGSSVQFNQQAYKIIGVMPASFDWPNETDLWSPLGLAPGEFLPENRYNESYFAAARLRPDVTLERAQAFMGVLTQQDLQNDPGGKFGTDSRWGMFVMPVSEFVFGQVRTPLRILLFAVAFVLLIACANIAGLFLAKATGRAKEFAIRAAMGAQRWALIRQTLAESVLLAAAGVVLGLVFAQFGISGLLALAPEHLVEAGSVPIDRFVVLFTAAVGIVAALLFGVVPAWHASNVDPNDALKEGSAATTGSRTRMRLRSALVISEIALALVLLAGAGLLLKTLANLGQINPGFRPQGVMTAALALPPSTYDKPEKQIAFFQAAVDRLKNAPGVTAAGAGFPLPFSGADRSASFRIEDRPAVPGDPGPHGDIRNVTPGYFAAMGIPILKGRYFTDEDRKGTQAVVIIDESLAQQYWPDQNPIGKHLQQNSADPWSTIVGVVGHIRFNSLAGDETSGQGARSSTKGSYYFPIAQSEAPAAFLIARTPGDPANLRAAIEEAVRGVDANQPVHDFRAMEVRIRSSLGAQRFAVTLLGVFAGIALLLAAVGLYALISFSVAQRTRELGIRIALGAVPSNVLRLVIAQGMGMVGIGLAIGLVAALTLNYLMSSLLYGVHAGDPVTYLGVAAGLGVVALLACYIPARRAMRVDPIIALRYE